MSLFVIADTHLSFGTDKPMDAFDGWLNYTDRLRRNWNHLVSDGDYVIIAGDVSWAIDFDELKPDFEYINALKGKKIILKGNHDYWWSTASKLEKFVNGNNFDTIKFLHNNAYDFGGFSVCGTRGWLFENTDGEDDKILRREAIRLKLSLDCASNDEKIVFLHYPPLTVNGVCDEIFSILNDYGIKKCFYGHLHGMAAKFAVEGEVNGVTLKCVSADRVNFTPYLVEKF